MLAPWAGVDETVVVRVAAAAGRHARAPLVEGDALLFAFLVAGIVGGFVIGYYFRTLFVDYRRRPASEDPAVERRA